MKKSNINNKSNKGVKDPRSLHPKGRTKPMKKKIPTVLGIVVLVVIAGAVAFYFVRETSVFQTVQAPAPTEEKTPTKEEGTTEEVKIPKEVEKDLEKKGVVVKVTASGFEPKEVTIKKGKKISFVNSDTKVHQIESDSDFKTDEMKSGDIWTFPCNEQGTFTYHLSKYPEMEGKVIVE